MLSKDTKKRIDDARDILVGQLPLPTDQIELITIALIYKFMDDQDRELEDIGLPKSFFIKGLESYSWTKLISNEISVAQKVQLFIDAIEAFQKPENNLPLLFREIFSNTFLKFRDGATLEKFLKIINGFRYDHSEELGNAFEYLLMKMGSQGANGQFRTPRNIIDFLVEVVNPDKTDTILDPACGTGGFLVSAFRHILRRYTTDYEDRTDVSLNSYEMPEEEKVRWGDKLTSPERQALGRHIEGYDITPMMQRLARVNLYLHEFKEPKIHDYDTLSRDERWKDKFDCILANPPFMTPKGGITPHQRFRIRANKAEVLFMDYIIEHLSVNGKAGVIVPEGIIFQNSGDYVELRKWLVEEAGLWAVVSLPANVFQPYSGVKTSIVFIDRQVARTRNEVILMKIENDGFSLNTNRTPIKKNDLPEALRLLTLAKNLPTNLPSPIGEGPGVRLLSREDFARLDAYKAATDARHFYDREWKTLTAALEKLDALLEKKKIEPKKYQEQREKAETEFLTKTGLVALPTDDEDAVQCFENYLKEPAIHYGTLANDWETLKFSNDLKKHLDAQREYNLSVDRYGEEGRKQEVSSYEMVELGEVCKIQSGGTPSREIAEYWNDGNIPWLRSEACKDSYVYEAKEFISNLGFEKSSVKLFAPKTTLIALVGATIGKTAFLTFESGTNQNVAGLYPIDENVLNPEFLYHACQYLYPEFTKLGDGNFKMANLGFIRNLEIPLPPLPIQAEIVAEIEQYQKVIDGCNLLIDNYKPVFEVKEEWERVKLGEAAENLDSKRIPIAGKVREGGIYPYYGASGIVDYVESYIFDENLLLISEDGANLLSRTQPIAFSVSGKIWVNNHAHVLKFENQVTQKWVEVFINQIDVSNYVTGSAQPKLNQANLNSIEIPLPSLEEQAQIVAELEADVAVVNGAKRLREKMQAKINGVIAKVWG